MNAVWTPTNFGTPATLGDDTPNSGPRKTIQLETFGGQAVEQVTPLFRGTNALRIPRGNVSGELTFTVSCSYASYSDMMTALKTEYARLNQTGTLVLTHSSNTWTAAGANLKGVEKVEWTGTRLVIRYSFGIKTLT